MIVGICTFALIVGIFLFIGGLVWFLINKFSADLSGESEVDSAKNYEIELAKKRAMEKLNIIDEQVQNVAPVVVSGRGFQPEYVQGMLKPSKAFGIFSRLFSSVKKNKKSKKNDYDDPIYMARIGSDGNYRCSLLSTSVFMFGEKQLYIYFSNVDLTTGIVYSEGMDARVRLTGSTTEEVEDLALAFNNMASSLQKSEYQRQEFVANVSHELKTPMTTISGYVDGMLDGTIPPERHRHYMQIVSDETKRLSRLVRSMLDISMLQSEGTIPEEKMTRFDACACAGEMLITFEQKILSKNLNVEVDLPEHAVYTIANRDYISQVIYNLLDNAVKFCHEGRTLGLRIREGDEKIYISVFNEGSTIPADELALVFDRFHKLDKSRTQNRDGWGLGLYIVKTIVGYHGEDISVTSLDGRTEFTFTLPLAN